MPKLIYLAVPYSGTNEQKQTRFDACTKIAAELINAGHFVFSPITHCHPIAIAHNLPGDFVFWQNYNRRMISLCDQVLVLCLDGWKESKGINGEVEFARQIGKDVNYRDFNS